jgi:hypothetical protein
MDAHSRFDLLWKSGKLDRKSCYSWLSKKLDIPLEECHIGMMDVTDCNRVVEVVNELIGLDGMPVEDLWTE